MLTSSQTKTPHIKFEFLNWVGTDPLPRDQEQSHLLHEPRFRDDHTDPMTGKEVTDIEASPCLEDGNMTLHFETAESRKSYVDLPIDHPNEHLPFSASDDDDRGG